MRNVAKNLGSKRKLERDADHRYALDGRTIPGVTSIIAGCGLSDYSMVRAERLELARIRGLYVHAACQFYDEGDLNEDTLSDTLVPYLQAWKKFRKDSKFKPKRIETMGYSNIYDFAGQCDRIGETRGKPAIVDIKPPTYQRWWELQLTAYSMIFFPGKVPILIDVSLLPDGTYRVWQAKTKDFLDNREVFLAALRIYKWKGKGK